MVRMDFRLLFAAALVWAVMSGMAPAYAQDRTIFERREGLSTGSEIVRRVISTGGGWRNIRVLRLERFVEREGGTTAFPISRSVAYLCGERQLILFSVVENLSSDEHTEIVGVSATDEVITPGEMIAVGTELSGYLEADEANALLAAITPLCASAPASTTPPEWLPLAKSSDTVLHLVPSRFSREGNVVRFWVETRYTSDRTVTMRTRSQVVPMDDYVMEVTRLEPHRGYELSQEEADCGRSTLRRLRFVEYDAQGSVAETNDIETRPYEVVPGSIGERVLQSVCAIR